MITDPSKPLMLEVEDAEEREVFLANARQVWNQAHPEKQREPGRHGDSRIITVLREVLLSLPPKRYPSIRNLTNLAEQKFKTESYMAEKFPDDRLPAAWDTIYRYAKLTLIFLKRAKEDTGRNLADMTWVSENVPASHETVKEILDVVSAIQPDMRKAIESLDNIPRIVNESGIPMTPARTKSLQRAILAFQVKAPPSAGK